MGTRFPGIHHALRHTPRRIDHQQGKRKRGNVDPSVHRPSGTVEAVDGDAVPGG